MRFESLPFEVDRFTPRPGRTSTPVAYFLTHAHADHLIGLTPSTTTPIYTTGTTAFLAHVRTGAPLSVFRVLPCYRRTAISQTGLHATLLPVFHCPGACMVYVEGGFGQVVHTGDFRVTERVMDVAEWLRGRGVDGMFVDATYCNPVFKFPGLEAAGAEVVRMVREGLQAGKNVWLIMDSVGKEELLARVARGTGRRVVVSTERYAMVSRVLPGVSRKYLTSVRGKGCYVRVAERWEVRKGRKRGVREGGREVVVILASGCAERGGMELREGVLQVLYSSHSNFEELRRFVGRVGPGWVGATAESAGYEGRDGIVREPGVWFGELTRGGGGEERERERESGCVVRRGRVCDAAEVGRRVAGVGRATGVGFDETEAKGD